MPLFQTKMATEVEQVVKEIIPLLMQRGGGERNGSLAYLCLVTHFKFVIVGPDQKVVTER
jgi:hypothetical protein